MGTLYNVLLGLFIFCGIILTLLILLRKGESGGLSSAFGGVGGGDLLGVRAQKQLDKVITYVSVAFIFSAILLNTPALRGKTDTSETKQEQKQEEQKEQEDKKQ